MSMISLPSMLKKALRLGMSIFTAGRLCSPQMHGMLIILPVMLAAANGNTQRISGTIEEYFLSRFPPGQTTDGFIQCEGRRLVCTVTYNQTDRLFWNVELSALPPFKIQQLVAHCTVNNFQFSIARCHAHYRVEVRYPHLILKSIELDLPKDAHS